MKELANIVLQSHCADVDSTSPLLLWEVCLVSMSQKTTAHKCGYPERILDYQQFWVRGDSILTAVWRTLWIWKNKIGILTSEISSNKTLSFTPKKDFIHDRYRLIQAIMTYTFTWIQIYWYKYIFIYAVHFTVDALRDLHIFLYAYWFKKKPRTWISGSSRSLLPRTSGATMDTVQILFIAYVTAGVTFWNSFHGGCHVTCSFGSFATPPRLVAQVFVQPRLRTASRWRPQT